jgi:peptidoglycan/xylan/chitin deacetylase (PgdA/CDA1 family)
MQYVTLTFDNGPDPEVTPAVLDILEKRGIKSTFFVVGRQLAACRAPAERAHAEGHWIGNHTWSHSIPFRNRGDIDFIQSEIDRTQDEIGTLSHPDRLFRPYGGKGRLDGSLNAEAVTHLVKGRYTCVVWNAVPGDFDNHDGWVETALPQVATIGWPLVVLHDVHSRAMQHLDRFLGQLQNSGVTFEQNFPPNCIAMCRGHETELLGRGVIAS